MGLATISKKGIPGSTFEEYRANFPYQGDDLFYLVFERNQDRIKAKKADLAVANLKKIFNATFELSAKGSFDNMSLRDLSNATGISMGGLYSCISKKEDIALMVLDIVELVTGITNNSASEVDDELLSLDIAIRYHLYASTILQPWVFFLYFETRTLLPEDQQRSKQIELDTINMLEQKIIEGREKGLFKVTSPYFVAHTILITLQDWYLKPWKHKHHKIDLEHYSRYLFLMVKKLLVLDDLESTEK